ncbi:hypothetical protein HYH03_005522 [Edaphochlamys debaryana]|uniref:Uncharacterized protein n=1 Tax=Edaphochlamys debaryana TaxID=47281 RepID=A0A835Y6Z3_9CHLO|nr:hypothetical protein HYH03_005522 [Edaphochlamys debaryana]|eukprot:KAG2496289.1 hypothetical protein HYH03_005522 [Edaphochlamys debaryana]
MQLALLLPNLRELDLRGVAEYVLPRQALDLSLMYDSLSRLPSLDTLSLPSCSQIPGVEALAGTLQSLSVGDELSVLRPSHLASLAELRALKVLAVHSVDADGPEDSDDEEGVEAGLQGPLIALLKQLPPAINSLTWDGPCADGEFRADLTFGFSGRSIEMIHVTSCPLDLLASLAREIILPDKACKPGYPVIVLDELVATPMGPEDWEAYMDLHDTCGFAMIRIMSICDDFDMDDLERLSDLVASAERLWFAGFLWDCRVQLRNLRIAEAVREAGQALGPWLLPPPAEVLSRAMEALAPARSAAGGGAAGMPGAPSGNGASASVLLLRGPRAAELSQLHPRDLRAWMIAATMEPEILDFEQTLPAGRRSIDALSSVQALPSAAALLVMCDKAEGAAVAAVLAKDEGLEVSLAWAGAPDEEWMDIDVDDFSSPLAYVMAWAVQTVVRRAWDEAAAAGVGLFERVEWVLAVRASLAELPQYVSAGGF